MTAALAALTALALLAVAAILVRPAGYLLRKASGRFERWRYRKHLDTWRSARLNRSERNRFTAIALRYDKTAHHPGEAS